MENVLASLASCSSIHIISLLKEQEQKISGYSVELQAERKEEPPRKRQRCEWGVLKNAEAEAEGNFWSVGKKLKKAVAITSSFEIVKE